jgi:hypothetical protein
VGVTAAKDRLLRSDDMMADVGCVAWGWGVPAQCA